VSDDVDVVTIVVGQERSAQEPVVDPAVQDWSTDEVCAAAVDRARDALREEVDDSLVGDWLGLVAEGPLVVSHYFAGNVAGYQGWRWAVTVTRAPDSEVVTIDETALLPDEIGRAHV
jgi:predicted alpha/beta hydrolase